MGKPALLLRLEGVWQSWGARSRWDSRDTAPEPTKSGVLGLLGCALGIPVYGERLLELDRGLRFGVRVEAPGRVVEDYQTITGYLPTAGGKFKAANNRTGSWESVQSYRQATILSPRDYLEDASFLAAMEETAAAPPGLLAECAAAVKHPHWPFYLGRKACIPTRPVFEAFTEDYDNIEAALLAYEFSWKDAQFKERTPKPSPLIWLEDAEGEFVRQDVIQRNQARLFGFRQVRRIKRKES